MSHQYKCGIAWKYQQTTNTTDLPDRLSKFCTPMGPLFPLYRPAALIMLFSIIRRRITQIYTKKLAVQTSASSLYPSFSILSFVKSLKIKHQSHMPAADNPLTKWRHAFELYRSNQNWENTNSEKTMLDESKIHGYISIKQFNFQSLQFHCITEFNTFRYGQRVNILSELSVYYRVVVLLLRRFRCTF
jgi:hypothetical protein